MVIKDASGAELFRNGALVDGALPRDAHRLGATILDKDGVPIERHRVWAAAKREADRFIPPGGAVEDRFALPPFAEGESLRAEATWWYRRYNPAFSRWVFATATGKKLD